VGFVVVVVGPGGGAVTAFDEAGFDPFGRDPDVEARMKPMLDALVDKVFKAQIEGLEHIPHEGRALLVANHGGALPWDALVLCAALARSGRAVRPLVEDPVMTAPFLGTLLTRLGCVRASQDNAARLLNRHDVVAVFPEGMQGLGKLYRRRHKLQRFGRGGFVKLALRQKAPLLPVAIVGAEDTAPLLGKIEMFFRSGGGERERSGALPYLPVTPLFPLLGPLGLLPLPARWRIRVGAPFAIDGVDENDDIAVGDVAAKVRDQVQKDVDELVEARGKQVWL
jgi:1-acyl-sn-glycerol-3-phosphate acyltransferase